MESNMYWIREIISLNAEYFFIVDIMHASAAAILRIACSYVCVFEGVRMCVRVQS